MDTGELPLRHQRRSATGQVALVGGGPGDPGLISVRGRRLLAEADVVLVDRLAPRALVDELEPEVLVIDVGKTAGHHPLPQEEINRLLVEHAQAGRRVVRLKGGDPFVLGRGGEEALACVTAGVTVEVVPGVTSAVSVPAAAGIPVTHRGQAKQVTIASGHEGLDWASLAAVEGTLVLLMGVSGLTAAARELVAHGKDASTPVAVVERGFAPDQRTTVGTLATIAGLARELDVRPPAVVVIGSVVDLHDVLG
jgi:uroporphyrin-III C-methyltransferase/precorrin-2 dehydrogenase/sirohydrochlorin ferrochelatase